MPAVAESPRYDLLIRGGRLIDPASGLDARLDLAVAAGKVAEVGPGIDPGSAAVVVDATGQIVTPGWIDLHTHVYHGVSHYGVDPDATCLPCGVTTVLDAGTAGSLTFEGMRRFVIDRAETRVLALVHISGLGLLSADDKHPGFGEAEHPFFLSVEGAVETARKHADVVLGIKVRLMRSISDNGRHELEALRQARAAADALGRPLMLHPAASATPAATMLDALGPGDVFTHCYHGHSGNVLDEHGRLRPEVRAAINRGVLFDVGHGQGSFSYEMAARCLEQGLKPHTISTDLHTYNLDGPVYDMATTLTKFLLVGLDLPEVIGMVTATPAAWMGRAGAIGTLAVGAEADLVVAGLDEGDFALEDTMGEVRRTDRRLVVRRVYKAGRPIEAAPPRASALTSSGA